MQASWNQWSGTVNNYATSTFPNPYAPGSNVPGATSFSVPPVAPPPVANPPLANSQFSNLYGAQPAQNTQQQQWQQWEQWQQQYAQWQQQYGDKYQGPVPTPALMPNTSAPPNAFSAVGPPLPPSAPTAQPPPPDSVPPSDKDESNKRPHDGTGNEDAKKQKSGKNKQETLESLIESEKTFDQQFKSWEASFLQWKEQNVNHPDKTQYKEYEAKCESYREQLLQKREVLRKKRENKEAEVAAAAKEAALATSSAAQVQQPAYKTTATTQSNQFMAPPNLLYPPLPSMFPSATDNSRMMPNQSAPPFMSNYPNPMFSMPPPPSLPPMTGPPPLSGLMDEDVISKQKPHSLEFLTAASTLSNANKSIPGLDLVGSERNPNANFPSNLPPTSSLFTSYNQDITKPLHTTEDKPFNFPRPPAQQNYNNNSSNNSMQNQYSYPPGRSEFENDSRMNHSGRNVPYSQFDRLNQGRDGGNDRYPNAGRDANDRFPSLAREGNDRFPSLARDGNDRFPGQGLRDGNDRFANHGRDVNDRFQNQGRDGMDGFANQTSFPPKEYGGGRDDFSYRKNESGPNFRNNDRNNFGAGAGSGKGGGGGGGGATSSFSFNSDKYAKYLEDEYDDSRFRDPEPEDDYSPRKYESKAEPSFRNNNFSGRQSFRGDGSFFGNRSRGGGRDFNDRNFRGDTNNSRDDGRATFQDRNAKESGGNFGGGLAGFSRDVNRFGGGRGGVGGFGKPSFGRDNPDPKESPKKFDQTDMNSMAEPLKPISLLDLPPMKPPETFQPPPLDSFDPKFPPPLMKPLESFDQIKMSVNVPNAPFSAENGSALANESSKLLNVPDTTKVPPHEDDPMLTEPFIPSQIFEYHHTSKSSEASSSFEPIWVFDYSHGKKKGSNPFNLLPKSDASTDLVVPPPPKHDNLFKNDSSWEGEPWEDAEKKVTVTPLPERTRNIPPSNTSNNERPSSTLTSLLDRREPVNSENNNDRKEVSWLNPKITLRKADDAPPQTKLIDDLLLTPGRSTRPPKIVIFMRGPPGSGKSYTAKLIKDKEVEMGGSAPRILSLDDYYSLEDLEGGEPDEKNYNALESSYLDSLIKSFKKNITDGFFPFIIVDCINDKNKKYEEMYNFAKSKGFQAYICEMDRDIDTCKKQNVHGRSEEDIQKIIDEWESTPSWQTVLDIKILSKPNITEMEVDSKENAAEEQEVEKVEENTDPATEQEPNMETETNDTPDPAKSEDQPASSAETEAEDYSSYMEVLCSSKWEKMEQTEEKLARLDGVNRKRSTSFKEWLQLPEEGDRDLSWYTSKDADASADVSAPKKKRVRWADLEERVAQQKMREIGFVVGHTDWKRMMDPSFGGNALTQTKYI